MPAVGKLPQTWKSTLLLPRSPFPPRAVPADRSRYLKRCTDDLYKWQRTGRAASANDTEFILHDGPPYANGPLHVGHALNKILKDITCRVQLSKGKRVNYVPGWDCHGLPIELKALEKWRSQTSSQGDPGRLGVRNIARELAASTVEKQGESFREWAIMADWGNAWKTMDRVFEVKQLEVFKSMVGNGLIDRRYKPVYWSPSSQTALAEAELEYNEEHLSNAAFIKYPIRNTIGGHSVSAVVWTTTPWSLPANRAIAVNPDFDYIIVQSNAGMLLLGASRIEDLRKACNEELPLTHRLRGVDLVGLEYDDPSFSSSPSSRPILAAHFVSPDSGSGLVHMAPGHGIDDYEVCLSQGIPAYAPTDDAGRFTADACPDRPELLAGKELLGAGNNAVIEIFQSGGFLLGQHQHKHKYPYDWRTKKPVIIRATEQWFADVSKIRTTAVQALDNIRFIPPNGKPRLTSFLNNRSEWCISRQRSWGVPIPALYHNVTGEALLTVESIDHIIQVINERGTDAWWVDDKDDPAWIPPALRKTSDHTQYRRGIDTLDVWFDSGTSWTQMEESLEKSKGVIADVYLEGTDQHRGWFQSSLLTHIARESSLNPTKVPPRAPYKTLITHGFTLDSAGRKMSKSMGNVISPDEIMGGTLLPKNKKRGFDAMGPDALRLWVASSDYTSDVRISETVLKATNASLSKYRVAFKFLLGALEAFIPPQIFSMNDVGTVHQLALAQLRNAFERVRSHLDSYEYNQAVSEISRYVYSDLSAFYMEVIKDPLYAGSKHAQWEAQATLFSILRTLQVMLAPVTPLMVEETWDYMPAHLKQTSVHPLQITWAQHHSLLQNFQNPQLEADWPALRSAITAVKALQESVRSRKLMGSSLESFVVFQFDSSEYISSDNAALRLLSRYSADLDVLCTVSKVDICTGPLPSHVHSAEWSESAAFNLEGVDVKIHVYKPNLAKCVRCWRYLAHIDPRRAEGSPLCQRCETVVEELQARRPDLFPSDMDSTMPA